MSDKDSRNKKLMSPLLDLNDPIDARTYIAKLIETGFMVMEHDEDHRTLSDEDALDIAYKFFMQVVPPRIKVESH